MASTSRSLRSHQNTVSSQALGNDLLLSIIFETLKSSEDLKSCRAVCQDWRKEATKTLRNLNFSKRNFVRLDLSNEDKKLSNFISTFSPDPDPNRWLISCFRLDHKYILNYDPSNAEEELIDVFFEKFGSGIKSLTFDLKHNYPYAQLNKWLNNISKSVQELRIWMPRRYDEILSEDLKYENVAAKLAENSENLSSLNYLCLTLERWTHPQPLPTRQHKVLQMILNKLPHEKAAKSVKICLLQWETVKPTVEAFQESQQFKNLKILDISEILNGEMKFLTEAAGQAQLKLEFLGLRTSTRIRGADRFLIPLEIHDFLATQTQNLKMLEWASPGGYFKIPECGFPNLKKLRLIVSWDLSETGDAESIAQRQNWMLTRRPFLYDHFFPQLEELELESESERLHPPNEFLPLFLQRQPQCKTLKKFGISYPGLCAAMLSYAYFIFRNITSLQIGIHEPLLKEFEKTRHFFTTLWRSPTFIANLQELSLVVDLKSYPLRGKYELDSLFSGVPEATVQQVSNAENICTEFEEQAQAQELQAQIQTTGSILNFKHLKKLSISSLSCYGKRKHSCRTKFRNFSVFCTFDKITNLEYLHLDEGIRAFSNAALAHLKRKATNSASAQDQVEPSSENLVEEVFRSGFTYKASNEKEPVNLIDLNRSAEEELCLPLLPPGKRCIPTIKSHWDSDSDGDGR